jgi:branched-subunit amino acid aminotransferase/4-amino-4-deoxychorismate lyase
VSAAAAAARAAKAAGEDAKGQLAAAQEAADAAAAEAVDGDMTGTLKPFTRSNIKGFVADAMGLLKEEL